MEPTRQEFLYISQPEKYLFYTLAYLSIAVMFWQIWIRAKLWRRGKPVTWAPSGRLDAFKFWVGNVWGYVIEQRKVRGSRKRSGAPMHLLIFYGFLALFIGTTLLAINTYSPVKFHKGLYFLIYEVTLDVMGAVFLMGLVWALFRRARMSHADIGAAALAETDSEQQAKQSILGRRRPLGSGMTDYAALGLLLVVGATGFILEGARIAVDPGSAHSLRMFDWSAPIGRLVGQLMGQIEPGTYRFLWWFHAAWVYLLLVTIPQMRIRHLVMAIFATAGNPTRVMGELEPIAMQEVEQTGQIGVALAKDYSRWHLMSLDACMECGRCTEVCPAWNTGKALNPKQVVQDIRGAMVTGAEIAPAVSEEALWACTTCNACVEACPVLIRHVDLIVDSRRNLVAEGKLAGSAAVMLRQTGSTGNAWGQPSSTREDWMKGLDIPLCRDGVEFEYLFWVGCAGATDPGAVKTTKAVAQLLKKAGVSFACLGQEEACTGDPARRVGDEFLFQEKAMENTSAFERYKVTKIVTPCPHCFNTLKNEYQGHEGFRFSMAEQAPEDPSASAEHRAPPTQSKHPIPDAPIHVFHHSQLLAQLVQQGKLKSAEPARGEVAYHDPCYLARINGESDAPRAVLGEKTDWNTHNPDGFEFGPSGSKNLAEPKHFARKTLCCGAGGGRMWMDEPPNKRPGERRAKELVATGAKTVAVGCPFCRIMLDASVKQVSSDEINLVDIAEMLQQANS